jgi:hypothetical protein
MRSVTQRTVTEWSFTSSTSYQNPFSEIEVGLVLRDEKGAERVVPGFWAGGNLWKVRFSLPSTGEYHYRTVCSDSANADLGGQEGDLEVTAYTGDAPLLRHGRVMVAPDNRHFQFADGTPFFWLADTWWMGLTTRLDWPQGFQTLALDRVQKGFSVIQIIAGLYPDMPPFDERGANEVGFPWETDFSRINPAYFDAADRKIEYLVSMSLMPCIVGCCGYFLSFMGTEKLKQHWRYLVARYGAYPVVWCLAGETTMPYYLSKTQQEDRARQKKEWTEIGRYLRSINAHGNLISTHQGGGLRAELDDYSVLDFDMLQTGHGDRSSLPNTVREVTKSYNHEQRMPFVISEVCYEGIGESCREEVQRLMFWAGMLSGTAGHTYGANGIWQLNSRAKPYGTSPHGMAWGDTPWEEAYKLPGSAHVGAGKRILEHYAWHSMEPHPEWVEPHWTEENSFGPYAAGIPGELRVIYLPNSWLGSLTVKALETGVRYHAYSLNPSTGEVVNDVGLVDADENGDWVNTPGYKYMPVNRDWVMVLERQR